jgi:archaellin
MPGVMRMGMVRKIHGGAVAAPTGYPAEVITDSPVLYWRLGESAGTIAEDATSNNRDGTYNNTPTLGVPGALAGDANTAVSFASASSETVSRADEAALDLGDVWTLEAWVKMAATGSGAQRGIVSKGTAAYYMRINSSDKLEALRSQSISLCTATVAITDTNWHHVVATKNGTTVKLYLDGVDVSGPVTNQTCTNTTASLWVGADSDGSNNTGEFFNGSIDEVAVYGADLSGARVTAHYNAGLEVPQRIAGLQGWWQADAIVGLNDGDPVATWEDAHTSNKDLTQATSAARPTYQTNELNGLPIVRFDGTDDWMTNTGFTLAQPTTVFIVFVPRLVNSSSQVFVYDGLGGNRQALFWQADDRLRYYAGTVIDSSTAVTQDAEQLVTVVFNGASSGIEINGAAGSAGNAGAQGFSSTINLGAQQSGAADFAQIDVAEFLVYDTALSAGDRDSVESYLTTKWGL